MIVRGNRDHLFEQHEPVGPILYHGTVQTLDILFSVVYFLSRLFNQILCRWNKYRHLNDVNCPDLVFSLHFYVFLLFL